MHADATFTCLENKVWFENSAKCMGKLMDSLFVKQSDCNCTGQEL